MTTIDIDAVRNWLERIPGRSLAQAYGDDWDAFEEVDRPVVTLFGSYDTGKSSLLRRLLIDSGTPVPDWLTISARHETFEVNEVGLGDCLVRDTPGFAVGASDIRGQNNTRRALAAAGLTDIGIAVLTPQLATAERETLQRVIAGEWPAGGLWFVISRFDEAGVNPEYDPDEYRALSERKVRELREVFELDGDGQVFVVSQDPFQIAGPDTDLDREEWDPYRQWDGMDSLTRALESVSVSSLPQLRAAAGHRYWAAVVGEVLGDLRSQLVEYDAAATVAANGVARRDGWQAELDTLDRAARVSLDGLVEDVVRRAGYRSNTGTDDLEGEIRHALDKWFTKHEARLHRLTQSISKSEERERTRPSWEGFAALVEALHDEGQPTTSAGPNPIAPHVGRVGETLIAVLKAANGQTGKTRPTRNADGLSRHIGAAEAALPLVLLIVEEVDRFRADHARQKESKAAQDHFRRIVDECTERAHATWNPFVDEVRQVIETEVVDQVALDKDLRELVRNLREAVLEGERLVPV